MRSLQDIRPPRKEAWRGFDALRLFAMGLVVLEHALTISGHASRPILQMFVGQLGVAIFCGLSGFLALQPAETSAWTWLCRRFDRILLPYWLVLVVLFAVNVVVQDKPMSLGLVVSEFLGLGYFTHAGELVGVHLWFISLILLCYLLAALAHGRPWLLGLFAAVVAGSLTLPFSEGLFRTHALSFLLGGLVGAQPRSRRWPVLAGFVVLLVLAVVGRQWVFVYPLAALLALVAASMPLGSSSPAFAGVSRGTYPFYLVHGPIFVGIEKVFHPGFVASLIAGTILAALAAWALDRCERACRLAWKRLRPASNRMRLSAKTAVAKGQVVVPVSAQINSSERGASR